MAEVYKGFRNVDYGCPGANMDLHETNCPTVQAWKIPLILTPKTGLVRKFETGATRDAEDSKFDYEGFLCPLVIERYGQYMHGHRKQADGALRASDNWKKGIDRASYMKSLWRHFHQAWKIHRGYPTKDDKGAWVTQEDALCGVIFNSMGLLHEILKAKECQVSPPGGCVSVRKTEKTELLP